MRAYYKDKDKNRICMVCDTVNKPLAGNCKTCKISFKSITTMQKIVRTHNESFAQTAVEDILIAND